MLYITVREDDSTGKSNPPSQIDCGKPELAHRLCHTENVVWNPVLPPIVVEVRYDRFTGGHFRHGAKFIRWRRDKSRNGERIGVQNHNHTIPH